MSSKDFISEGLTFTMCYLAFYYAYHLLESQVILEKISFPELDLNTFIDLIMRVKPELANLGELERTIEIFVLYEIESSGKKTKAA